MSSFCVIDQILPLKSMRDFPMLYQRGRLETFGDWPFSDDQACSKNKLAEAGFYMISKDPNDSPNVATCFVCFKSLYWEDTDNPWEEHIKHGVTCPFAKLNKPECEQTIEEFIDMANESIKKLKKISIDLIEEIFEKQMVQYSNVLNNTK